MKTAFEKQNSVQYIPTALQKTKVVVKHRNIIQVNEATYLCKLCIQYLKKGKLPPMAVKNKLELHHTDKYLKDNGLALTELEAALISKNIMFEKIFPNCKNVAFQGYGCAECQYTYLHIIPGNSRKKWIERVIERERKIE